MLSDYEYQALILSLKVAFYTICWLIPIGIGFGWLLAKKQFIGKSWLDSLIHLPLVLPPVVIGYLLLISMGRQGFIGQWLYEYFGLVFSFSWKGAVLACVIVALPLMVRSIRLSLENVDPKLEQAAATLGASPLKIFFTITLPLTIPGIITGTMLSFARTSGSSEQQSALCRIFQVKHRQSPWRCLLLLKLPEQSLKRCAYALSPLSLP